MLAVMDSAHSPLMLNARRLHAMNQCLVVRRIQVCLDGCSAQNKAMHSLAQAISMHMLSSKALERLCSPRLIISATRLSKREENELDTPHERRRRRYVPCTWRAFTPDLVTISVSQIQRFPHFWTWGFMGRDRPSGVLAMFMKRVDELQLFFFGAKRTVTMRAVSFKRHFFSTNIVSGAEKKDHYDVPSSDLSRHCTVALIPGTHQGCGFVPTRWKFSTTTLGFCAGSGSSHWVCLSSIFRIEGLMHRLPQEGSCLLVKFFLSQEDWVAVERRRPSMMKQGLPLFPYTNYTLYAFGNRILVNDIPRLQPCSSHTSLEGHDSMSIALINSQSPNDCYANCQYDNTLPITLPLHSPTRLLKVDSTELVVLEVANSRPCQASVFPKKVPTFKNLFQNRVPITDHRLYAAFREVYMNLCDDKLCFLLTTRKVGPDKDDRIDLRFVSTKLGPPNGVVIKHQSFSPLLCRHFVLMPEGTVYILDSLLKKNFPVTNPWLNLLRNLSKTSATPFLSVSTRVIAEHQYCACRPVACLDVILLCYKITGLIVRSHV
ncbi:LOW QUALITY PROTEIN: hypothetical protein CVT26_002290 [Gymnopilus dilepis]|uniref:Uncharacterized protein n=1 Tax=Gymnopilus dilepis TaxID=231916 RepID=A0A409YP53_9AGAR|nr:LOW QUALITY PROTEIN: hypothetical protein CVT26_002290 [Gymnopilus dilepis]